jgi:hypothetical protein
LYSDPLKGLQFVLGQSESVHGSANETSYVSSQGMGGGGGGCVKDYLKEEKREEGKRGRGRER